MRNLIIIICLLAHGVYLHSQTRYASASGGGDGTSQSSTWTLQQAFSNATAGMTVYIQAGNYPANQYTQSNSGTSGNLITFIGCDTSWTPVVTNPNSSTYTLGDTFSGNDMPFIDTGLTNGQRGSGTGLITSGDYVRMENMTIRGYATGIRMNGSNSTFVNMNTGLMGDFRDSNTNTGNWNDYYLGRSVDMYGSNNTLLNSFHRDSDAQGISVGQGGNHTILYLEYQGSGDAYNDDIDYPILVESDNNEIGFVKITVTLDADHPQHGLTFKPTGTTATNNNVHDITLVNTRLELQFPGTNNNTITNVTLINEATTQPVAFGHTNITIGNGAHHNTISNVVAYRPTWFVRFFENNDSDGIRTSGNDNTIINAIVINPFWGVLCYAGNSGNGIESMPKNFKLYNATIIGSPWLNYYEGAPTGTATGGIYNSIFKNMATSALNSGGQPSGVGLDSSFEFDYINRDGGLAASGYAPFSDSNFTSLPVAFVDEKTSVSDAFDYKTTSEIPGFDFTATEPRQGFDYNGLARTAPFTIGAVEFEGSVTPPATNNIKRSVKRKLIIGL